MKEIKVFIFCLFIGLLIGVVLPYAFTMSVLHYGPIEFWFYLPRMHNNFAFLSERDSLIHESNYFGNANDIRFWFPYFLFLTGDFIPLPLAYILIPPFLLFFPLLISPTYFGIGLFSFSISVLFFLFWLIMNYSREKYRS